MLLQQLYTEKPGNTTTVARAFVDGPINFGFVLPYVAVGKQLSGLF